MRMFECELKELDLKLCEELGPAQSTNYFSFVSSTGVMGTRQLLISSCRNSLEFINYNFWRDCEVIHFSDPSLSLISRQFPTLNRNQNLLTMSVTTCALSGQPLQTPVVSVKSG